MSNPIKKRGLRQMNKYEEKILLLSFIPSTLLCICMTGLLYVFFDDFGRALTNEKTILDIAYVKHWGILVMSSLWVFFVALIMWVCWEAHHLVGAFNRVKKELHDVSTGERKDTVHVRDKDQLFQELLENINVIIKKLYD